MVSHCAIPSERARESHQGAAPPCFTQAEFHHVTLLRHARRSTHQFFFPVFISCLIAHLLGSSLTPLCVSDLKCPDKCSLVAAMGCKVYVTLTSACTPSQDSQASFRYPSLGETDLAARIGGAEIVMNKWSVEAVVSWACGLPR